MRITHGVQVGLDFGWRIPVSLSWSDIDGGKWLDRSVAQRYLSEGQPAQPFPVGKEYRPLTEQTGLFRQFADLNPTEEDVSNFAASFGLLQKGHNILRPDGLTIHGEPLSLWSTEIRLMRRGIELWDAVSRNDVKMIDRLLPQPDLASTPLAVIRARSLDSDDAATRAIAQIRALVDSKLEPVAVRLLYAGVAPKLQIQPRDLLTALWLQFALAIDGLKTFRSCAICGRPFEVSRSESSGKRADARFCGQKCRMNKYRGRISEARRLYEQGIAIKDIARRLEAPLKTVRGWINGK